jgi:hypothetical protein
MGNDELSRHKFSAKLETGEHVVLYVDGSISFDKAKSAMYAALNVLDGEICNDEPRGLWDAISILWR